MNIFVLDTDPAVAAQLHCDKHVVKMILESAQLLCTALEIRQGEQGLITTTPYRATHRNHPCAVWARETRSNYLWLCDLGEALAIEHLERYNPKREHASYKVITGCRDHADWIPAGPLTPFAQAMPERYRVSGDPVLAYRGYYANDKRRFAAWRAPRTRPDFMDALYRPDAQEPLRELVRAPHDPYLDAQAETYADWLADR